MNERMINYKIIRYVRYFITRKTAKAGVMGVEGCIRVMCRTFTRL